MRPKRIFFEVLKLTLCLTATGIDKPVIGHFRPNLSAKYPKDAHAISEPIEPKLRVHEASSSLIWPVGRGECVEVSNKMAGDDQPKLRPIPMPNNNTVEKMN